MGAFREEGRDDSTVCSARSNTSTGTTEAVARAASDWSGDGPASPPLAGEPWPPRADRPRWLLLPPDDDGVPMMAASTAAKGAPSLILESTPESPPPRIQTRELPRDTKSRSRFDVILTLQQLHYECMKAR